MPRKITTVEIDFNVILQKMNVTMVDHSAMDCKINISYLP